MGLKEQMKLVKRGKTLLNQNLTIPQISKKLHISKQRAYDLFYLSDETAAKKLEEARKEKERLIRYRDGKVWEFRGRRMTKQAISELLGINETMVRSILDSDKVRADKLTSEVVEKEKEERRENKKKAKTLRDKGSTYKQIAKEMVKSESWVMITLGVTKRQQSWSIERKRKTAREYKRLLSDGCTTQEAEEILGTSRAYLHRLRGELEEEERLVWNGTPKQYEKMRQKERFQFQEARKKKVKAMKKAEEEEKKKNRGTKPLALGYIRVSKREQAVLGGSLKYQVEEIKKYAEENGYRLVEVLEDPGMHGDDYNRAQLQELIKRAEAGEFDCVIVWMLDRLMRDYYKQQKIMHDVFDPCGVDVKSTTQEMDRTTPHGKFMFVVLGALNEYELDLIKYRAKRSSEYEWSKGEWKAKGAVPLAFRMDESGKYLEEDPEGMKRLKKIYRLIIENKGRIPTHPNYKSYDKIAVECGVGKGKVSSLARTTLKSYLEGYKMYMGNNNQVQEDAE